MSDVFDPYYEWLGIPPKDQPADHYRLLGIEKFESNTEVIRHAANQREAFLRSFQNSSKSELSQQLLNEVTAAKLCLLDSHQKARYDATLQAEATAEDGSDSPGLEATTAPSPEELSVRKKPGNIPPFIIDTAEPAEEPDRQKIRKRSIILIAVPGMVGMLAIVAVLLVRPKPLEVQLYDDTNKNGQFDPGEGVEDLEFDKVQLEGATP